MDLTVEAECYGVHPVFKDYEPPEIRTHISLDNAISSERSIAESQRMSSMVEAARRISKQVKTVPTGFFITGPFTLAGQIVGVQQLLLGMFRAPDSVATLLESCTRTVVDYAKHLSETGIDFLVLADMSCSLISPKLFEQLAGPSMSSVVRAVSNDVVLHICGRVNHLLKQMGETGVAAISIDQNVSLVDAASVMPNGVLVFGNYSPTNLAVESIETIQANVTRMLSTVEKGSVVASTGCDIPVSTPPENIQAFVQSVKSHERLRR
jgi:uroporphyrinogen decarboxylase